MPSTRSPELGPLLHCEHPGIQEVIVLQDANLISKEVIAGQGEGLGLDQLLLRACRLTLQGDYDQQACEMCPPTAGKT